MTIRYTCTGCESVLKIKDEKAGTNAKCPKCKLEFVVPAPASIEDGGEVETEPVDDPVDLVDMPIELTPEVSATDDFDPMAVLGGLTPTAAKSSKKVDSQPVTGDRKPSVAELMKDFEASKKKGREDKSAPEVSRPSMSSTVETSGSAASALTRAYQQKRDSASTPSVSVKDAKAAEKQKLMVNFITTRAAPGILIVSALLYGYYWYMTREIYEGPPLYEVTGQVIRSGIPAPAIQILFEPVGGGMDDTRHHAQATSDAEGNFRLMYDHTFYGVPAGSYLIGLMDVNGAPIPQVEELTLKVEEKGENKLKINF